MEDCIRPLHSHTMHECYPPLFCVQIIRVNAPRSTSNCRYCRSEVGVFSLDHSPKSIDLGLKARGHYAIVSETCCHNCTSTPSLMKWLHIGDSTMFSMLHNITSLMKTVLIPIFFHCISYSRNDWYTSVNSILLGAKNYQFTLNQMCYNFFFTFH